MRVVVFHAARQERWQHQKQVCKQAAQAKRVAPVKHQPQQTAKVAPATSRKDTYTVEEFKANHYQTSQLRLTNRPPNINDPWDKKENILRIWWGRQLRIAIFRAARRARWQHQKKVRTQAAQAKREPKQSQYEQQQQELYERLSFKVTPYTPPTHSILEDPQGPRSRRSTRGIGRAMAGGQYSTTPGKSRPLTEEDYWR